MEFRTCEEYVLNLLEKAYERIRELEDENESLKLDIMSMQVPNNDVRPDA